MNAAAITATISGCVSVLALNVAVLLTVIRPSVHSIKRAQVDAAARHLLRSLEQARVGARRQESRDQQYAAIGFAISEAFLAGWSASREEHNADLDGDKPFDESVAKVELDKYLDQLLEQTEGEAR